MAVRLLFTLGTAALLLSGSAVSQKANGRTEPSGLPANATRLLPPATRFAVEFSKAGSAKFRKRDGSPDTEGFYEKVALTNNTAIAALNFTSEIFHGTSFDLVNHTVASIAEIEALPEVATIYPVSVVYAPKPESVGKGAGEAKWDPHVLTKVNDAHKKGFDGKGVIVAIVDTGIDYTHPALGGGFGPGFKVEAGWDFVGDAYNVDNPSVLYPDPDPMDCGGHGTHVAGILASGDSTLPGVAPNARLRAYKVFGCDDGTMEDTIAVAFLKAFEDGADIITASLGSDRGFPESMIAVIINRITQKGTFVSTAAGNSGAMGPYYTSSLGNSIGGLDVGSVKHSQLSVWYFVAKSSSGESRKIMYVSDRGTQWALNGTKESWVPPNSRDLDICWEFDFPRPPGGKLKNEQVLVLPRGYGIVCDQTWQPMDSALLGKTKYVLFYNYAGKLFEQPDRALYRDDQPIGFASINREDGLWLQDQADAGHKLEFDFKYEPSNAIGIEDSTVSINDFSSWGPTLDARMKPEISAPGGRVLSTFPVKDGGWAVFSGTSMATPYIAGVAALFFQSGGGRSKLGSNPAETALNRIVSSGKPVYHYNGTSTVYASIAQQGAGLVDALKVTTSNTSISPAVINLNDTIHFKGTHTIIVENSGDKPVTYSIAHEAAPAVRAREWADAWVNQDPYLVSYAGQAIASFSSTNITILPKGKASFELTITEPNDIDPLVLAVYGGYIHIIGSNGEAVKATYMGVHGSMLTADTWETERGVPQFWGCCEFGDNFEDGREFTLEGGDAPTTGFNILWSTKELSFELVHPDWKPSDWVYPIIPGKNGVNGTAMYMDPWTGNYYSWPWMLYPRNSGVYRLNINNIYADGRKIESGTYRLLARALRTYGDYQNPDHWQFRLSNTFVVKRK